MKLELIAAPSNLGLRPLHSGHVPGTWRAPEVLIDAGLVDALAPVQVRRLPRPRYSPEPQSDTRLYNGQVMRTFNLLLAEVVGQVDREGRFPLVVGGDCSVLLGALAGVRRNRRVSLVHIDGHSDFRHPGNYDPEATLGAVAGMDLALATGRGEAIMTEWPAVAGPLVPDKQVVQLGERESRGADFAWPDVLETAITVIDVFEARKLGGRRVLERILRVLNRSPKWPFWIHLDVDVLDQSVMPAVDSPGSPGLDGKQLIEVCTALLATGRCCGMTVTVYDPDRDPTKACADYLVSLLTSIFTFRPPNESAA